MNFKIKGFLKVSFIAFIILGVVISWLAFGEGGFLHLYRKEKERQAYLEKIRELERANRELLEEINRLREDNAYIESVARRELGLVKDNELIYRFSKEQDKEK